MKNISFKKHFLMDLYDIKILLLIGLFLYFPITFLNISQPIIIGYAVQHVLKYDINSELYRFPILFFLALLSLIILECVQGFCLQKSGQKLVKNLRRKGFIKLQKLPMSFLDRMPIGKLLTRLANDAESVAELFSMGAVQIVGDILFLLSTMILLLVLDTKLAFYAFLSLPILFFGMGFARYFTKVTFVKSRQALSSLNAYLAEYLLGNATIQMFTKLPDSFNLFSKYSNDYIKNNKKSAFIDASIYSFIDAISYITFAFVLWGAFNLKEENALKISVLVAFIEALSRFYGPIRDFSTRYTVFENSMVALSRIYELLEWPEEKDGQNNKQFSYFQNKIEFKNVNFAYQDELLVLKNISFSINKGQKYALVGYTGAGKSSVIKLINRFYSVTSGEILIDNVNIESLSLSQLRNMISIVPQEIFLFRGTIRDNLCFGKLDASDEEIWHALRMVQLDEMVIKRGGLLSRVNTKGQNFSQGEKQLLAFARTIIANPPIIILDEATASVDKITEKKLKIATKSLLNNRTAIIIAHRLSTIKDSDEILFFHEGSIIEQGNHRDLMSKNSQYKRMVLLQEKEHKNY